MKNCKQCNNLLADDASFCSNCGYKVEENDIPTPTHIVANPPKKTNVCSLLAVIFGAIGIIPLLNFVFLPIAIILAIIGLIISKNRKKGITIASAIVVIISLVISILWVAPTFSGSPINSSTSTETKTSEVEELEYLEVYVGDRITTDFVTITINEISTARTIKSKNSTVVFNANSGEEYLYMTGTITNTSNFTYDIGSLGSASYGNTDCKIDCDLEMNNGESEYGVLLTDDGSMYGLSSSGTISPQETVTYYFVFTTSASTDTSGKITIAFSDDFYEKPAYNHLNCEHLYEISVY